MPEGPGPEEGLYLFCLTRPLPEDRLDTHGLDERCRLAQWRMGGVAAVYCHVVLEDFRGPQAEARLQDLAWLGPRACRHQEVVARVAQAGPVLPCRFGMLFSSARAIQESIEPHRARIGRFLDRVADREEWAVKGFLDRDRAEYWLRTSDPALAERVRRLAVTPGQRYFQEKQLHAEVRKQVNHWCATIVRRLEEELSGRAEDYRSLRGQAAPAAGRELRFHGSFLLARTAVADFHAAVERLAAVYTEPGLTLEITGPWPPYSFAPALGESESVPKVLPGRANDEARMTNP